jgi:hypothetical protein
MSALRGKLRKFNPPPQPGACPICGDHTSTWILDHSHVSNSFRGYICDRCNRGLGCFRDDQNIVQKAFDYLNASTEIKNKPIQKDL